MWINRKAYNFIERKAEQGVSPIVLYGGRRAGKTFTIGDWLLLRVYNFCEQVLVVSFTDAQGRDGAYSDFCDIASEFAGRFAIHRRAKDEKHENLGARCRDRMRPAADRLRDPQRDFLTAVPDEEKRTKYSEKVRSRMLRTFFGSEEKNRYFIS